MENRPVMFSYILFQGNRIPVISNLLRESIPSTRTRITEYKVPYATGPRLMPLGLRNAPSTLKKLRDTGLESLLGEEYLNYLDDIITFVDLEEMLEAAGTDIT